MILTKFFQLHESFRAKKRAHAIALIDEAKALAKLRRDIVQYEVTDEQYELCERIMDGISELYDAQTDTERAELRALEDSLERAMRG